MISARSSSKALAVRATIFTAMPPGSDRIWRVATEHVPDLIILLEPFVPDTP